MADITVHVQVNEQARKKLFRQLEALRPQPEKRFRLAREAAREVKKYSARRVSKQQSLEGGGFAPRSKRTRWQQNDRGQWRKKRRMLAVIGMAKNMGEYREGDSVQVTWKQKGKTHWFSEVAWKHQHGMSQQLGVTPEMKKGLAKWHVMLRRRRATRKMAQALLRNGYKFPARGRHGKVRLRRVSAKWIMENMSQMQAAWILRLLVREDVSGSQPKKQKAQTWEVRLPARPFLGVTEDESASLLSVVSQKIVRQMKDKK